MVYGHTAHNKTVSASAPFGRSGGSSRLGHSAALHSHASFHPHFASPGLATQALIRAGKTSDTAGTLCAIWNTPNFLQKGLDKGNKKLKNEDAPPSMAAQGEYKMLKKMKVIALDSATSKKEKPADAYGVRYAWQLGGTAPATPADLPKSKFSRKTSEKFLWDPSDQGKPVHYATAYENSKGDIGP